MRAAIYTRVSSDPKDTGRSVEEQEAECRSVCVREGWEVVRVFCDNDRGASRHSKKERPQYASLRAFLDAGHADVLVMWEGSRAQRDLSAYASLRDLCAQRGILYSYSGRTFDLTRTDDRFSTGLDALLAEREADVTRDRVLRSVRANAATGRPHGKLAYGYAREYDDRGVFVRQYVKDTEAAVIRECARRIRSGESLYAIAQDLNERKVPAPRGGRWLPTQVKRLVVNPAYIGQRVHRGVVVGEAVWPSILKEDEYLECKAILEDPRRSTVRDLSLKYLLSGTAKCGVCSAKMRVVKNRGYYAYACFEKFCTGVKVEYLEAFITEVVMERLARPDFLAALTAPAKDDAADAAIGEAHKLRERLDGFYEAAAAGEITPGALAKIEARLLADIETAEQRAYVGRVPAVLRSVAGPDVRERWEHLAVGTRREVIDLLMSIRVNKTVRGSRFRPERVEIEWKQ